MPVAGPAPEKASSAKAIPRGTRPTWVRWLRAVAAATAAGVVVGAPWWGPRARAGVAVRIPARARGSPAQSLHHLSQQRANSLDVHALLPLLRLFILPCACGLGSHLDVLSV